MKIGQTISTGNTVVNQLPAGSTLVVSDKGTMIVTSLGCAPAKPAYKPQLGDYVVHEKYGYGTVSRASSRHSVSGREGDTFVTFEDNVFRRVFSKDLAKA